MQQGASTPEDASTQVCINNITSTCQCLLRKLPFQHMLAGVAVSSRYISVAVLHCALNTVVGQPGAGVIAMCAIKVLLQTTPVKAPAQPQAFFLHAVSCVGATWPCGLPIWRSHVHVGAHAALMIAGHTRNCLHAIPNALARPTREMPIHALLCCGTC